MKFTFGYDSNNKFDRFTYKLCKYLPFIPTVEVDIYRKYRTSNNYCPVKHIIVVQIFSYMWEWRYFKKTQKWEFRSF